MLRIACLHTAESNIAIFDAALEMSGLTGVELCHVVRADLLAAAGAGGGLTPGVASQAADALRGLQAQADAVLLTCSTLGPAADMAAEGAPVPVMRVDAALAEAAVRGGGKIVLLCAVETTVEPTRRLFEAAARATGAEVAVRLVPHAWEAFRAGDRSRYHALIARAADEAAQAGATRVVLAQASMAPASSLAPAGQAPLSSPLAGLKAIVAAASRTPTRDGALMDRTPDPAAAPPELIEALNESEADLAAGRVVPSEAVRARLRETIAEMETEEAAGASGAAPRR